MYIHIFIYLYIYIILVPPPSYLVRVRVDTIRPLQTGTGLASNVFVFFNVFWVEAKKQAPFATPVSLPLSYHKSENRGEARFPRPLYSGNAGLVSGNGEDVFQEYYFCNTYQAKCVTRIQDWLPGVEKVVSGNATFATPLKRNAPWECSIDFWEWRRRFPGMPLLRHLSSEMRSGNAGLLSRNWQVVPGKSLSRQVSIKMRSGNLTPLAVIKS